MKRGSGCFTLLVLVGLLVCVNGAITLEEKNQLNNIVDWLVTKTAGPFNYDKAYGGPGGIATSITALAQAYAEDTVDGPNNDTALSLEAGAAIETFGCNIKQYYNPSQLASGFVNAFDEVRVVTYTGILAQFETILSNNPDFRRVIRCSNYDNYAFGIKKLSLNTFTFVLIAIASDPDSVCASGNNVLTATPAFFCPSSCGGVLSTSEGILFVPAPVEFTSNDTDTLRSTTVAFLWNEQKHVPIESPVTLDVVGTSFFTLGPDGLGAAPGPGVVKKLFLNDSTPNATLQVGNGVASWMLRFDTTNLGYSAIEGSVSFQNRILGAVFTARTFATKIIRPQGAPDGRLVTTDPTFSQLCVPYDPASFGFNVDGYRGLEWSTSQKKSDTITIRGNTLSVRLFSTDGIDNVRIFTECNEGVFCNRFTNISGSARTLTNGTLTPPESVKPSSSMANDDTFIYYFRERAVLTSSVVSVDRVFPTKVDSENIVSGDKSSTPGVANPTIAAGTPVQSWYFRLKGNAAAVTASVNFHQDVIGIIFRGETSGTPSQKDTTLFNSDSIFGDFCTDYGVATDYPSGRGLADADVVSITNNRRTVSINIAASPSGVTREFRILTRCSHNAQNAYTLKNLCTYFDV